MAIEFFESEEEVEVFLKHLAPLVHFTFFAAAVSVLTFFGGLTLVGRIKVYFRFPTHTYM
jgi:hypothetical protein